MCMQGEMRWYTGLSDGSILQQGVGEQDQKNNGQMSNVKYTFLKHYGVLCILTKTDGSMNRQTQRPNQQMDIP